MKKLMTMIGAVGLAFAATAAFDDALLAFSTVGPDKYADGTTVLDGECYALVWTKNGATFGGIAADGTAVAETDEIVLLAPVAKGGRCPYVLFQIDSATADRLADGTYGVYLLDTRVAENGMTKPAGVKSGYTSTAGFCYVGAYQENGVTLIAAVMGGQTRNMAWTDLKRLFAYGMAKETPDADEDEPPQG